MATYGPNTSNVESGGAVCARSWFAPRTTAGNAIPLDSLNPDGTVQTENAGPDAESQNQATATDQGGPNGEDSTRREEDETGDQGSAIDTQCRPIRDLGRLFSCCFYCSSKGKERGRSHDATPRIVEAAGVISPTPPPPQETPEQSPARARLPPRESVSPTRCTLQ